MIEDPEDRMIIRKSLIKIDCQIRDIEKKLKKIIDHSLSSSINVPKLREQIRVITKGFLEIPKLKMQLLKDLKMPETEEEGS